MSSFAIALPSRPCASIPRGTGSSTLGTASSGREYGQWPQRTDLPLRAAKAASCAQLNSGYGADSGPSRGRPLRSAFRPIEASKPAVRYVRFTSILLKTRISASITIQETPGGLDEKFLRGSADRSTLPRATLLYAMPSRLSAEMTRRARKRDFRGGPISEFFNNIRQLRSSPSRKLRSLERGQRIALVVAQIAACLAGVKRWLGIRSVAGRSVCCNFDDFGRILAAEMFGRPIGESL